MLKVLSVVLLVSAGFSISGGKSATNVDGTEGDCSVAEISAGICDGGDDDELDVWDGDDNDPPPADPNPIDDPPIGAPLPPGDGEGDGNGEPEPGEGWQCVDPGGGPRGNSCVDVPPIDDAPEIPPISWYDVESFAPLPTSPVIEPFGAAIARAPMNVAVPADAHTVRGELFGLPMSVTFTPDLFTIDYGDGAVVEVAGTATWEALGQEQLTPTATSHVYPERGTATVTVDVSYSATVDFGSLGVYPVNGHIVSRGRGVSVPIYEKQSYLVDSTCEENPVAPGC